MITLICVLIIAGIFVYIGIYTLRMLYILTKINEVREVGPDEKVRTEENVIAILNNGDKKTVINNNKVRKS